jgi:hypothetical protein
MDTARFVRSAADALLVASATTLTPAENAPALSLMTDFAVGPPATVSANRHIDAALNDMIVAGVRALIVTTQDEVTGLITAADILGEKPVRFLQSPLCAGNPCKRVEIAVGDIMTRLGSLETLELDWMMRATAGDMASAFASRPYTHMLVMEPGSRDGVRLIRGLVSKTRLERQLGKAIHSLVDY